MANKVNVRLISFRGALVRTVYFLRRIRVRNNGDFVDAGIRKMNPFGKFSLYISTNNFCARLYAVWLHQPLVLSHR
jgi:hypothetical protein